MSLAKGDDIKLFAAFEKLQNSCTVNRSLSHASFTQVWRASVGFGKLNGEPDSVKEASCSTNVTLNGSEHLH